MRQAIAAVQGGNMSQRTASKQFNVPRSTLQDRLSGRIEPGVRPGHPTKFSKTQEEKLIDYACNRASLGIGFGKRQFLRYAASYAKKYGVNFKGGTPSHKWWQLLKKRHPDLARRKPEGTASVRHVCMNAVTVGKYFSALKTVMEDHKISKDCMWNMDETGMSLDYTPKTIIARKGSRHLQIRSSGNRELITVIGCISAAGDALPPHMIAKGKTARSINGFNTENAPAGTIWSVSETGWTKQGIAKLWFERTFLPNIGEKRPQVLIVDGHGSHNFVELIELAIKHQIHLVELPAHTSNWLQPCDRTVYGLLKTYYNEACQDLMSTYPGTVINKANLCALFTKAWVNATLPSNIQSGFRACGIYPYNPNAIPSEAYLPNSLHANLSTDSVLKTVASTHPDPNPHDDEIVLNTIMPEKEDPKTSELAPVVDIQDVDPQIGLYALESTFDDNQLNAYEYVFNLGTTIPEPTFKVWAALKDQATGLATGLVSIEPVPSEPMQIADHLQFPFDNTSYPGDGDDTGLATGLVSIGPVPSEPMQIADHLQFPFDNTSYPGDGDDDILPYPVSKKLRKGKKDTHYFVLTSSEVLKNKKEMAEKKANIEIEKEEKRKARQLKANEKKKRKQEKSGKQQLKNRKTKDDSTPCYSCKIVFGADGDPKCGEGWISCSSCHTWFHQSCGEGFGILDDDFTCLNCVP